MEIYVFSHLSIGPGVSIYLAGSYGGEYAIPGDDVDLLILQNRTDEFNLNENDELFPWNLHEDDYMVPAVIRTLAPFVKNVSYKRKGHRIIFSYVVKRYRFDIARTINLVFHDVALKIKELCLCLMAHECIRKVYFACRLIMTKFGVRLGPNNKFTGYA